MTTSALAASTSATAASIAMPVVVVVVMVMAASVAAATAAASAVAKAKIAKFISRNGFFSLSPDRLQPPPPPFLLLLSFSLSLSFAFSIYCLSVNNFCRRYRHRVLLCEILDFLMNIMFEPFAFWLLFAAYSEPTKLYVESIAHIYVCHSTLSTLYLHLSVSCSVKNSCDMDFVRPFVYVCVCVHI